MFVAPEDDLGDVFVIYPNVVCVKLMKVSVYRQKRTSEEGTIEDMVYSSEKEIGSNGHTLKNGRNRLGVGGGAAAHTKRVTHQKKKREGERNNAVGTENLISPATHLLFCSKTS